MPWKGTLAYITGSVNEELLRRIEYLLEENRILRNHLDKCLRLTNRERPSTLSKLIGRVAGGRASRRAEEYRANVAARQEPRPPNED